MPRAGAQLDATLLEPEQSKPAGPLSLKSLVLVFLLFIVVTNRIFIKSVFGEQVVGLENQSAKSSMLHALAFVILYAVLMTAANTGVL